MNVINYYKMQYIYNHSYTLWRRRARDLMTAVTNSCHLTLLAISSIPKLQKPVRLAINRSFSTWSIHCYSKICLIFSQSA